MTTKIGLRGKYMPLIVAENIQKYYQVGEIRVTALKGVSFEIEPSSLFLFSLFMKT